MAVRAQEPAFRRLAQYTLPASVGNRPEIEIECLPGREVMMKFQRREIPAISALRTLPTFEVNQRKLS